MINSPLKNARAKKMKNKLVETVKLGQEKYYKLLIYINPNSLLIKEKLAGTYIEVDKFHQAVSCYYDILNQKPQQASIYIKLGHIFLKQNNLLDARSVFKKALEIDPSQQEAENYQDDSDHQSAILLEEKILELVQQLKIEEALQTFRELSSLLPSITSWKVLEKCSNILAKLKEDDIALSVWVRGTKELTYPKTFFIEKSLKEIPSIEIKRIEDIDIDDDQIKRYALQAESNKNINEGIDDLQGLLSNEKREFFDQGSFNAPIWESFKSYNILTIPKTIFAGTKTPFPLSGHTPMSLDGYWLPRFTQGTPVKGLLQYQASQIQVHQYQRRDEAVFVVPGHGRNKYYHAICNSFPALKFYKEMELDCPIVFPRFPIEIQPNIQKIQSLILQFLSISQEKVISPTEISDIYFDMGIFPQMFFPNCKEVASFYKRVSNQIEASGKIANLQENQGTYIYISRRDATRRPIENEEEIIEMLKSFGFMIVEMSNLSFLEQFSLVRNASVLVSPHGAGLTNMVFAKPGMKIVEFHTLLPAKPLFYQLAKVCGHSYYPLLCSLSSRYSGIMTNKSQYSKWYLDVDKLKLILDKVL